MNEHRAPQKQWMLDRDPLKGNAYTACLLTVLGLEWTDAPDFHAQVGHADLAPDVYAKHWHDAVDRWLNWMGYARLGVTSPDHVLGNAKGLVIWCGQHKVTGEQHAEVYVDCKLWHNPDPNVLTTTTSLSTVSHIEVLYRTGANGVPI